MPSTDFSLDSTPAQERRGGTTSYVIWRRGGCGAGPGGAAKDRSPITLLPCSSQCDILYLGGPPPSYRPHPWPFSDEAGGARNLTLLCSSWGEVAGGR